MRRVARFEHGSGTISEFAIWWRQAHVDGKSNQGSVRPYYEKERTHARVTIITRPAVSIALQHLRQRDEAGISHTRLRKHNLRLPMRQWTPSRGCPGRRQVGRPRGRALKQFARSVI